MKLLFRWCKNRGQFHLWLPPSTTQGGRRLAETVPLPLSSPSSVLSVFYIQWLKHMPNSRPLKGESNLCGTLTLPGANKKQLCLPASAFCLYFSKGKTNVPTPVVTLKFMCPTHTEAKQTKTQEFGAQKCLLQGPSKENGQLTLKTPKLPDGFQGRVFTGKICEEGCGLWEWLFCHVPTTCDFISYQNSTTPQNCFFHTTQTLKQQPLIIRNCWLQNGHHQKLQKQ